MGLNGFEPQLQEVAGFELGRIFYLEEQLCNCVEYVTNIFFAEERPTLMCVPVGKKFEEGTFFGNFAVQLSRIIQPLGFIPSFGVIEMCWNAGGDIAFAFSERREKGHFARRFNSTPCGWLWGDTT